MANIPGGEGCKSCKYGIEEEALKSSSRYCMRFPPQMILDTVDRLGTIRWLMPLVHEDSWCGEYSRG